MLGNWSFSDYFKREAIDWAWELVINIWKFPPQRLYATVFCPHLGEPGWNEELTRWRIANIASVEELLAMISPK